MSVDLLLSLNAKHAELFAQQAPQRRSYWERYSTELGISLCMDERTDVARMTQQLDGIYQQWRAKGAQFSLGHGRYGRSVADWLEYAKSRDRNCLMILAEHYSKTDNAKLGCRGFSCDREAALANARALRDQYEMIFRHEPLYPIVGSIDTDEDGFTFRGRDGSSFDLAEVPFDIPVSELHRRLGALYPDMPFGMRDTLIPFCQGILRQIASIRKAGGRPLEDLDHAGWVLAVGIGSDDWLREPNMAIKVCHYGPYFQSDLEVAATILWDSWRKGARSDYGMVLLTTIPFRVSATGYLKRLAAAQATSIAKVAKNAIETKVPDLFPRIAHLTGVIDVDTHRLHIIDRSA